MKIKIKLTDSQLRPVRNYLDDSGWDLKAGLLCSHVKIQPGDVFQCSSGLSIELPTGWEGQVRGRSSLNRLGIMECLGEEELRELYPEITEEEIDNLWEL